MNPGGKIDERRIIVCVNCESIYPGYISETDDLIPLMNTDWCRSCGGEEFAELTLE